MWRKWLRALNDRLECWHFWELYKYYIQIRSRFVKAWIVSMKITEFCTYLRLNWSRLMCSRVVGCNTGNGNPYANMEVFHAHSFVWVRANIWVQVIQTQRIVLMEYTDTLPKGRDRERERECLISVHISFNIKFLGA